MRKTGFTLIELLIVTVVIATLMGIVFRLAGVGGSSRKRAITVDRLQRLENAISGYYAAYGSYPPVPIHGSRNIYDEVDDYGVQDENGSGGSKININADGDNGKRIWTQINTACKSQPVAVAFPFNGNSSEQRANVESLSSYCQKYSASGSKLKKGFRFLTNTGGFNSNESDWRKVELFKFGLLSFLLPRYLFMLEGDEDFYDNADYSGQWRSNNRLPSRLDNGTPFTSWREIRDATGAGSASGSGGNDATMVSNLMSQAVCARWMPNFKNIISGGRVFYGVDTHDGDRPYLSYDNEDMAVHSHGGYDTSTDVYLLDGMTVRDGWGHDFYYCSDPPFQSYRLWSAGEDGKTFPPWFDMSTLNQAELRTAQRWIADDIVQMSSK